MPPEGVDPGLLNDFLTESGELIQQLDADLVRLESEPDPRPLLDQIFRALHTIKGAASFLNMPAVTTFAHAAEDALNRLRKGEVEVSASVIDALLRSVDVLKVMMGQISASEEIAPGPQDLIDLLHSIASGGADGSPPKEAPHAAGSTSDVASAGSGRALMLTSEKLDLLPGMQQELNSASAAWREAAILIAANKHHDAQEKIGESLEAISPTAEYFGFEGLNRLLPRVRRTITGLESDPTGAQHAVERAAALADALAAALAQRTELVWSDDELDLLLSEQDTEPSAPQQHPSAVPDTAQAKGKAERPAREAEPAETTVRVEVARLETLLNLVGEMVLTKNQILGVSRQVRSHRLPHELQESLTGATSQLDRLTSELQVGVMRTRMQPLNKLFSRYPRIVRDLARATGKQIEIEIRGGDTEVDKSVLELLADPMVHILRNSADHGIETPDERIASGKSPCGTIILGAAHRGGHVCVEIRDDGKGIDPEVIGRKAVQKGVITAEQQATMSQQEIVNLIFAPGFSTAEKVSDLSGRGVGMDVVRTNILKLGGNVTVTSVKGKGAIIEVLIPLTVAIMPAMLVNVGASQYAVPVASIVEIVRLSEAQQHSVAGRPVMRLRDDVLPLVDLPARLGDEAGENRRRFAVVVEVGQQRAGLVVDDLVGQQEVVIKPLDDAFATGGPFSGATIREDGDVSLIIDAGQLIRNAAAMEIAA